MNCLFCNHEYHCSDLVFTTPAICPFCVLGHGNKHPVSKELKTKLVLELAVSSDDSSSEVHRAVQVKHYNRLLV
jgi:hypothetical protein